MTRDAQSQPRPDIFGVIRIYTEKVYTYKEGMISDDIQTPYHQTRGYHSD